jgi:CDP-paratose 2-epimerase
MKNFGNINDITASPPAGTPQVGILEWFHVGDYAHVEKTLAQLNELGISHLRTGFSWADYHTEAGVKWYDWLMPHLSRHVEVLPCFLYTPPSWGVEPKTSAPPRDPKSYADFLDLIINKHGKCFEWVELWNEPNNLSEYDFTLDTQWHTFCRMITGAAYWCRQLGKKTVLGGMSPIDPNWLQFMFDRGVVQHFDAVGFHAFPHVFDSHFTGWESTVARVREVLERNQSGAELWLTEVGFSTWQHDERKQYREFLSALQAPVNRLYWYSLNDLHPKNPTVDGFHLDEREYSFGLCKTDGTPKLLYRLLAERKLQNIRADEWMAGPYVTPGSDTETVLITGGAGFIGSNLAHRLLSDGKRVIVLDNLSRPGTEKNVRWLKATHPSNLDIQIMDMRNTFALEELAGIADTVYHFASQVAVTTSCANPLHDFQINAQCTVHLLEAIRKQKNPPPLIFTSTNKVYGNLEDVELSTGPDGYQPEDLHVLRNGISEARKLDFHSPYGCSKGAADQYILDYARTYGLPATVFRMSCIYGPHQFGNEDQGWVAHFLISALEGKPITLYGDGRQVRDILFVEDLVEAMLTARRKIDRISGQAFNIGGGPSNSVSLLRLIRLIEEVTGIKARLRYGNWRTGDQRYYVSDIRKFTQATGWWPKVNYPEGIRKLYEWLMQYRTPMPQTTVEEIPDYPKNFLVGTAQR